jgi:predicted ATP-dependent endonuclease of OLD family
VEGKVISSIKLKNFMTYKDTEIKLGRLNVLVGVHGVGKTSLIRAISIIKQAFTHGPVCLEFMARNDCGKIEIGVTLDNRSSHSIVAYSEGGFDLVGQPTSEFLDVNCHQAFVDASANRQVAEELKHVYDVSYINDVGASLNGVFVPTELLSCGFKKHATVMSALLDSSKLACIDDIDAGLHFDYLVGLGDAVVQASSHKQLIVATNSPFFLSMMPPESVIVCEDYGTLGHINVS